MRDHMDRADSEARQHAVRALYEALDRKRSFHARRASRAREVETHGAEARQRRHQRGPGVRGTAEAVQKQYGLPFAVHFECHAFDELRSQLVALLLEILLRRGRRK